MKNNSKNNEEENKKISNLAEDSNNDNMEDLPNNSKENNENKVKEPLGDRIEDTLDNIMGGLQDLIYGPQQDFTHDIPATIEKPNGIRQINKVQTRRNFNKRLFGKKGFKVLGFIFVIAAIIGLIVSFVK